MVHHSGVLALVELTFRISISRVWIHRLNQLWIENSVFICGWESADVEDWLYASLYAILYKELEFLWISVSWGLESISHRLWKITVFSKSKASTLLNYLKNTIWWCPCDNIILMYLLNFWWKISCRLGVQWVLRMWYNGYVISICVLIEER